MRPQGTPFGRYQLVELLGRGGMGEVWRAYDTVTNRTVGIKLLPPHLAEDDAFVQRFRREAQAAAQLNSPHIVPIHDFGEIDGRLFVDMRLIEGRDLGTVLADGPLEPARAARIVEQVAWALHAAHKVGLIHRDVKPSNILLDDDDFAYLIDFGIARSVDQTRLTQSGSTIGTFQYMAPERLGSQADEDPRADVYSLACVFYECLIGAPPFRGDTLPQLLAAHLTMPPPRPSIIRPNVGPQVDQVIATGMAKDPDQRYATTLQLANAARDAITAPIQHPPVPGKPSLTTRRTTIVLSTIVIAVVAVIATAVGIFSLEKHHAAGSSATSSRPRPVGPSSAEAVRVTSSKLVTNAGTADPKAVVSLYEDFLCPACAAFEARFGPTVTNLIDIGAIAADYSFVAILDRPRNQDYSARAGAAAYCVADESIDAFRRFHVVLFSAGIQPSETGSTFPDNAWLVEFAREAGAAGDVSACIDSAKYLAKVKGMSAATNVNATPTIRINGQDYVPSTPDELVAKIKEIVGAVPGIESAAPTTTP